MAAIKQLAAVTRSGTGKGAARSVRREGRVPGVIYGGGMKPEPISVDYKDVNKFIYAGHFLTSIFELEVDGRKERVLPRDYQLDVVTDRPVHVDFFRLIPGSRVRIGVPVHVENREASPGPEEGRRAQPRAPHGRSDGARRRHSGVADGRPRRPRLSRFGACLGPEIARRLQAGRLQGRPDGRDHRPADGDGGRYARRRGPGRSTAARAAAPAGRRQGRRSAKGAAPAKGRPLRSRRRPSPRPRSNAEKHLSRSKAGEGSAGSPPRPAGERTIGGPMLVIAGTRQSGPAPSAQPPQHRLHGARRRSPARIASGRFARAFPGLAAEGVIASKRVILLKPQTYMNESGRSVGEALRFHKVDVGRADRHSRRARPRAGQGAGQDRRRQRRPQRPALDHRPCRQRL